MDLGNVLRFVARCFPFARGWLSRVAINSYATRTKARPRPFSLWAPADAGVNEVTDYTSWPGLTDRVFSARHLPPADPEYTRWLAEQAPDASTEAERPGQITRLFQRPGKIRGGRSSMLFAFFAQWFTDSFLRIDSKDRRRNTSNHEIDLCQIYGLSEPQARILRKHQGGLLKSQDIEGEEYPEYLFERSKLPTCVVDAGGGYWRPRSGFEQLFSEYNLKRVFTSMPAAQLEKMHATGLEMGNSSVAYVTLSTLFLREHNRLCKELAKLELVKLQRWDDERLFQTARNINIAMLIKLVVTEYINHVTGFDLFRFQTGFADKQPWYRSNWISLEFDLLYRWHGMVADEISIADKTYPIESIRNNNGLLERVGMAAVLEGATQTQAGEIGLGNTPGFLMRAESLSIKMGRDYRLRSYNEYRQEFNLAPLKRFEELTDDPALREELRRIYGTIDRVEYVVGIFAESHRGTPIVGDLMTNMVAYDAFTHIFSNPLLAEHVYNASTFTQFGLSTIETTTLQALVDRNVPAKPPVAFGVVGKLIQLPARQAQRMLDAAQ